MSELENLEECGVCHSLHPMGELASFDDTLVCPDCMEDTTAVCGRCGEITAVEAARRLKISPSTFYRKLKGGRQHD